MEKNLEVQWREEEKTTELVRREKSFTKSSCEEGKLYFHFIIVNYISTSIYTIFINEYYALGTIS